MREDTNNEAVQVAGANNFFGYPPTAGTANDCGPQNRSDLRGNRELGYLAPPLYGVWATAPYLHNGSVPNVWEVLKPADRKPLWRRKSKAPRWDQTGRVIMGYDTSMAAYDTAKLGWKYDTITCQNPSLLNPFPSPYLRCNPDDDLLLRGTTQILTGSTATSILAWNVLFPPTITNTDIENRKIYNAYMYGQGNGGHTLQLGAHRHRAPRAHRVPEDAVASQSCPGTAPAAVHGGPPQGPVPAFWARGSRRAAALPLHGSPPRRQPSSERLVRRLRSTSAAAPPPSAPRRAAKRSPAEIRRSVATAVERRPSPAALRARPGCGSRDGRLTAAGSGGTRPHGARAIPRPPPLGRPL